MHQQQTAIENIVGKGEIACNKQFLLFPQCFIPDQIIVSLFVHIFGIVSLLGVEFEKPKIGISGKGLSLQWQASCALPKTLNARGGKPHLKFEPVYKIK